jgi:hypothetical protein
MPVLNYAICKESLKDHEKERIVCLYLSMSDDFVCSILFLPPTRFDHVLTTFSPRPSTGPKPPATTTLPRSNPSRKASPTSPRDSRAPVPRISTPFLTRTPTIRTSRPQRSLLPVASARPPLLVSRTPTSQPLTKLPPAASARLWMSPMVRPPSSHRRSAAVHQRLSRPNPPSLVSRRVPRSPPPPDYDESVC